MVIRRHKPPLRSCWRIADLILLSEKAHEEIKEFKKIQRLFSSSCTPITNVNETNKGRRGEKRETEGGFLSFKREKNRHKEFRKAQRLIVQWLHLTLSRAIETNNRKEGTKRI